MHAWDFIYLEDEEECMQAEGPNKLMMMMMMKVVKVSKGRWM
jgi:hypothetical protein